jgi:hypothetical protein
MFLKRKARHFAGGHTTDAPTAMTYASVVSRESVCIRLLRAALNDLSILTADIQNEYLTSPWVEKSILCLAQSLERIDKASGH